MTLGDVLAAVSLVITTGFAAFCAMLLSALLFPSRASRAAREIEFHPWKCTLVGLFIGVPWALIGIQIFSVPNPVFRVFGLGILLILFFVAAAGSGGHAKLVAGRIARTSKFDSELGSAALGTFLVVGASLLPLVGWFVIAPILSLSAIGSGLVTSFRRKSRTSVVKVSEAS